MTSPATESPAVTRPLMTRLKEDTRGAHDAAESIPFMRDVMAGTLPREAFAATLPQLKALRAGLEERVEKAAALSPEVAAAFQPHHKFSHLYDGDIAEFGADASAPANPAVTQFLASLDALIAEDPKSALGAFYVLEGSNMGAVMIRKRVAESFGLVGDAGTAAMNPHGPALRERWGQLVGTINGMNFDEATQDRIVAAADLTFRAVGDIHNEVYTGA